MTALTPPPGNPPGKADGEGGLALLGALSLFLSAIDYLLPKPLPFMRLGLANLPLLLALDLFSLKNYCLLVLLKILGQAFITGSLFSYVFLFSLSGSALSAALMFALHRLCGRALSLAGTSLAGAFASNAIQLALARFVLFGESARYLAPPFLAAGIISGAALGMFAEAFSAKSLWLKQTRSSGGKPRTGLAGQSPAPPVLAGIARRRVFSRPLFFCFLLIAAAAVFLTAKPLPFKAILLVIFLCAAILSGRNIKPLLSLAVMAGIVLCGLFPPSGRLLFRFGPFIITQESLLSGLDKALGFQALVLLSKLITPLFGRPGMPRLPGAFGRLFEESFRLLEEFNVRKGRLVRKKHFLEALDEVLIEVSLRQLTY